MWSLGAQELSLPPSLRVGKHEGVHRRGSSKILGSHEDTTGINHNQGNRFRVRAQKKEKHKLRFFYQHTFQIEI